MSCRQFTFLAIALCLFFTAVIGPAQAGYSELSGEVRDPSGALVPSARVVATEENTGIEYLAATTTKGMYFITHLKPGRYSIKVEASGFATSIKQRLPLATGDRVRIDFDMVLPTHSQEVKVTAPIPLLNTETSGLGQTVSNRKIVELPLNGRSFVNLTALSAGVALPPGSAFPRINGGRPRTNEYLFDGISVLQPEPGQVAYLPVIDAIQEFKVQSNSISAEFGRFNGGVVNLSTKSGTNELHGDLFEFVRNEALNARNYFAPTTMPKPKFRRNQFGGTLGGPIAKNRMFFFVDYQGALQDVAQVRISTVPTALQRKGIFTEPVSSKVPLIYDPATTTPSGSTLTRQQFANNTIPIDRIDPVALALLARYPLPNLPGTANNYQRVAHENTHQHQFDARIDHRFSESNNMYGRLSYFRDDSTPAAPLPGGDGNLTSGVIGDTATRAQSYVAHYAHTFGANRVNDLGFGYSRRAVDRTQLLLDQSPGSVLSLPGLPSNSFGNALPTFFVSGLQQLGPTSNANSDLRTDVSEITDNYSLVHGKHTIKFGADLRWERLDITQPPSPTGLFRFSSLYTNLPGTTGTGFAFASFLLGQVDQFSIDLQEKVLRPRAHIQEYYVQDDWKIFRNFSLNAGVRYTLNFPSTEADNQGAVFSLKKQQLDYFGKNGYPNTARELHHNNFGPRIGFSWAVTPSTVVKSGYGLIWIEQAGITTPFTAPQFPFLQTAVQNSTDSIYPAFTLAAGPTVQPVQLTPDAGLGQGVFGVNRNLGSGYAQQWNLGFQKQFASTIVAELGYSGNKVTHLGVPDVNLNQLTVAQLSQGSSLLVKVPNPFYGVIPPSSSIGGPTTSAAQLLKPYPEFTTVSLYRNNVGNSSYNALYVRFEKRFSRGFSFLSSYTWSKLIDDASSVFDASVLTGPIANYPVADSFNRGRERDVSTGDIPHAFVTSYTYEFPLGKGHRFAPWGFYNTLLGGWSMSGILTMQSGMPIAVTQATNFNAFAGFGVQRPNLVGNPTLTVGQRTVQMWFNTSAFATTPQFAIGTASRNPVRGPDYRNFDLALVKNCGIGERLTAQFRGEIFNLANIPPLGQPNAVLGASGFGSITSAGDPRVVQLALKLLF